MYQKCQLKKVLTTAQEDRKTAKDNLRAALTSKQEVQQKLAEMARESGQARERARRAEKKLDRLRKEHGKDYSEELRKAIQTIAKVLAKDTPEERRAVRDQLLGMAVPPRNGNGSRKPDGSNNGSAAAAAAAAGWSGGGATTARGLVNFAELLDTFDSFSSVSRYIVEHNDRRRQVTDAHKAGVTAVAQSDEWCLPKRVLGALVTEKVHLSLKRRHAGGRMPNCVQIQKIYNDLERTGAGMVLEDNLQYRRAATIGDGAAVEDKFIEVSIAPALETRSNGVVTIDKNHVVLRAIKEEHGEGARDAVIQCRCEQIEHNDSGNYSATHLIDPKTTEQVRFVTFGSLLGHFWADFRLSFGSVSVWFDAQMHPAEIVRRMAVWLPGYVKVRLFYSNADIHVCDVILQICDDAAKIKKKLRQMVRAIFWT